MEVHYYDAKKHLGRPSNLWDSTHGKTLIFFQTAIWPSPWTRKVSTIINGGCVAKAKSAIFNLWLVAALTNWVCPVFPSLVAWSQHWGDYNIDDYCTVFITRFSHLVLPHLSQRWLKYWWLWFGFFITCFPHLLPHPGDCYIDGGAILDSFTFLWLHRH